MRFNKKVLPNGLRIVTVPIKDSPAVTVLVMVEAGSKYETKDINGISHFLEHMCFKGTKNRPNVSDIMKELDGLGAQSNAFTDTEMTGYYAKVANKHLYKVLDIVSDLYLNPTFPEAEMQREKGVIIQEINMYEDIPQRHIHDLFQGLLYGDEPAGWNIAGPIKNIKKMKRDDFINYRNKHYVASATTIIVSGSFDEKKLISKITKSFENISTLNKHKKLKVKESQNSPALLVKQKDTDQTHIVIGFRAYDTFDKRMSALSVLRGILGAGMSSRLFHKLREEMGVCYYVHAGVADSTDHGHFDIATGVDNKRVEEVVGVILEECKKLTTELVSEEELKKVKDSLIGNMYLSLETSDSMAEFYGIQETIKHKIKNPKEYAKEIEKVTAKDIQKVAKDIFQNKKLNMAVIGNIKNTKSLKKVLKL